MQNSKLHCGSKSFNLQLKNFSTFFDNDVKFSDVICIELM